MKIVQEQHQIQTCPETYAVRLIRVGPIIHLKNGSPMRILRMGNWKGTAEVALPDAGRQVRTVLNGAYEIQLQADNDAHVLLLKTMQPITPATLGVRLIPRDWAIDSSKLIHLVQLVDSIADEGLRMLINRILSDPTVARAYVQAPASQRYHHAFPGGLVTHSLEVAHLAEGMNIHRNRMERDLLVMAALLHDVAKVGIYTSKGRITETGRLKHHDLLTAEYLASHMHVLDTQTRNMLRHLLYPDHKYHRYPGSVLRMALKAADALSAAKDSEAQAFANTPHWHSIATDRRNRKWYRYAGRPGNRFPPVACDVGANT